MQTVKLGLAFALCFATQNLSATIVPSSSKVIVAELEGHPNSRYAEGMVLVNKTERTITLLLQPASPGAEAEEIVLENAIKNIDECQVITWKASLDQRPVDGYFTEIQVVDNRFNRCPTFVALSPSEVRLQQIFFSRLEGIEVSLEDQFVGSSLKTLLY